MRLPVVCGLSGVGIRGRGLQVLTGQRGLWGSGGGKGPPDETTPDETTPDETTPDEITPDEITPDGFTASHWHAQALGEWAPEEMPPDEFTPDEITPG